MKKKTRYTISKTDNSGKRHIMAVEFKTKTQAKRLLKKILSKPKKNKHGYYPTSYRNAQTGTGINNPRIKKLKVYR